MMGARCLIVACLPRCFRALGGERCMRVGLCYCFFFFFFQAEDGIRDGHVTGVQTCALPIWILTFSPASNQIQIQTYSPYINQFESTSAGNFTINYDMQGTGNNFTLLASNTGVLSGNPTSYAWSNLSPGSQYEWYVTVSNSSGTTVGPLWSFTTTGGSPVTLSPSSLSFPSQLVNTTSAVQTVTLTNTGTAALSVTSIVASGDFMQTNTCGTSVAAGANCAISVTFTPTATGTRTGAVTITDNT